MSSEAQPEPALKPLFWVGRARDDLREFPEEVREVMGFALWQAQNGGKHDDAKVLQGFGGAGVLEIVANDDGSTFRGVYTVKFAGAVYVLHAFKKKSKKGSKTPRSDVVLIRKRLRDAEAHHKEWQAAQEKKDGNDKGSKGSKGPKK
jgi:phage-related protein